MALYGKTYSLGPTVRHIGSGASGLGAVPPSDQPPETDLPVVPNGWSEARLQEWAKTACTANKLLFENVGQPSRLGRPGGFSWPFYLWVTAYCTKPSASCIPPNVAQKDTFYRTSRSWADCARCVFEQYVTPDPTTGKAWFQMFGWTEDDHRARFGSPSSKTSGAAANVQAMLTRTLYKPGGSWVACASRRLDVTNIEAAIAQQNFNFGTGATGVDNEDAPVEHIEPTAPPSSAPPATSGSGNLLLYVAAGAALAYVFSKK